MLIGQTINLILPVKARKNYVSHEEIGKFYSGKILSRHWIERVNKS
jgi:hypothetical protein